MQFSYVNVKPEFRMLMLDCLYEDTRLCSLQTQVDDTAEDFDPDDDMDDFLFYKGIMSHHAKNDTVQIHVFPEQNVFKISEGKHTPVLFYLTCSADYQTIYVYRRNFISEKSEYICEFHSNEDDLEAAFDLLSVHQFYTLNDDHALLSFHLSNDSRTRFALIDAQNKRWLDIKVPPFFQSIECMINYRVTDQVWVFIKTGEHMPHEREQIWRNQNEQMPEQLILIEAERLIDMLKCNSQSYEDDIVFSAQSHEAFVDVVLHEDKFLVLISNWEKGCSDWLQYDFHQRTGIRGSYPFLYNRLYTSCDSVYVARDYEGYTTLYDVNNKTQIKLHTSVYTVVAMIESGLLIMDTRLGGDHHTLYIRKKDQEHIEVVVQGKFMIDQERQCIIIFES